MSVGGPCPRTVWTSSDLRLRESSEVLPGAETTVEKSEHSESRLFGRLG